MSVCQLGFDVGFQSVPSFYSDGGIVPWEAKTSLRGEMIWEERKTENSGT
jgi:hypothetical protein